jgi:hypothetical protein
MLVSPDFRYCRDFPEQPGVDVEHESADVIRVREERGGAHACHGLAYVLVDVGEGLDRPGRTLADFAFEVGAKVLGDGLQTTVGVVDQHDGPGAEGTLADSQGTDGVIGDDASGVADGVAVTECETERGMQVDTGVHAGHHGNLQYWAGIHARIVKVGCVAPVGFEESVGDGSGDGLGGLGCSCRHASTVEGERRGVFTGQPV